MPEALQLRRHKAADLIANVWGDGPSPMAEQFGK